jgi:signal transduction histidine kinase
VAATVARMREFYRERDFQMTLSPVNINQLVQQVIDLTRARWSDIPQQCGIVIDLHTELASDLPVIMGVDGEIREALTNLIFNAVDAMPNDAQRRHANPPYKNGVRPIELWGAGYP